MKSYVHLRYTAELFFRVRNISGEKVAEKIKTNILC